VGPEELDQGLDTDVGECHDAIVSGGEDPDETIFGIHLIRDIPRLVLIFSGIIRDTIDRGEAIDLVDVSGYHRAWHNSVRHVGHEKRVSHNLLRDFERH
jgi:hypothetical protein